MAKALHDITDDLDGRSRELWEDLKQLVEDARPVAESALSDARERGTALGASLVSRVPDQVLEKVPDAISDRLPATKSGGSRAKKLLLVGGLAGAAAALFAWMRRGSAPMQPATGAYPPAPASSNGSNPNVVRDDPLDLPVDEERP